MGEDEHGGVKKPSRTAVAVRKAVVETRSAASEEQSASQTCTCPTTTTRARTHMQSTQGTTQWAFDYITASGNATRRPRT
jgi:hypothetical protein